MHVFFFYKKQVIRNGRLNFSKVKKQPFLLRQMRVLNLLGRIAVLSQLRGCSIIVYLCKRMIFARSKYFSVSGVVRTSGKHCLRVV